MINVRNEFDYSDIPHFPVSTVKGHAGTLIMGYIGTVPVMCMKGRAHYYEGYDISKVSETINNNIVMIWINYAQLELTSALLYQSS